MFCFVEKICVFEVYKKRECPKDVLKDVLKELSERQVVILEMIIGAPSLSAKAMSEKMSEKKTNVERTIERDMAKLKKFGILTRIGGRKEGRWVINVNSQIELDNENHNPKDT